LSQAAGSSQQFGKAVFADKQDPNYQAILAAFKPVEQMLKTTPRMDMPGAQPSSTVSWSCQ
jgi:hypothetical protein